MNMYDVIISMCCVVTSKHGMIKLIYGVILLINGIGVSIYHVMM